MICPTALETIASTLLRTTTAVLSHSPASFNYQAFLMDPLSRSPAKRSKTVEVVRIVSAVSERNLFPETQLCKLCVIPRSLALHGVCSFLDGDLQFLAVFIPNKLATYMHIESTLNAWH